MSEITNPWILLIEDIQLYIRGQGRNFASRERGLYLERLNSSQRSEQ